MPLAIVGKLEEMQFSSSSQRISTNRAAFEGGKGNAARKRRGDYLRLRGEFLSLVLVSGVVAE